MPNNKKTLLYNGKIWEHPEADCILIKKGKIAFIGKEKELSIQMNTIHLERINLKQKLLLPGFIDTHTHLAEYIRRSFQIDCSSAKTMEDLKRLLKEFPNQHKGYGLKLQYFDKEELHDYFLHLNRSFFFIASSDYHSYFTAGHGYSEWPILPPKPVLPRSFDFSKLYQWGLTSVHEMAFSKEDFHFYDDWNEPLQICRHFPESMLDDVIKSKEKAYSGSEQLKLGSFKFFYDGSIGSNTAFLFSDSEKKQKIDKKTYKNMEKRIKKALSHQIPVSIHAIGNRATDDLVTVLLKHKDLLAGIDFIRIEHAQTLQNSTIEMMKALKDKLYFSMQPLHMHDDLSLLQEQHLDKESFRFHSMKDFTIGFSSDAPIVEPNPFLGIYYAITHPLNKKEAITSEQAIHYYTKEASKLSKSENIKGSISINKQANLILIDSYTEKPASFWLTAKSYLTMIEGQVVYQEKF